MRENEKSRVRIHSTKALVGHMENAKVSSPILRHCIAIIGAALGTTARALA